MKTKIEELNSWKKKHEARHPNSGPDEQNLEAPSAAGKEEQESVEGQQPTGKTAKTGDEKASPDKPEDRTDTSTN